MTKCENCGGSRARVRRIARTYGKGDKMIVIENVPVVSCPDCGESYLTAETLHEIERLKIHHKTLSTPRSVDVVAFV